MLLFSPLLRNSSNKAYWVSLRYKIVKQDITSKKYRVLSLMFIRNKKFYIQKNEKGQHINKNQYFIDFLHKAGDKCCYLRSDPRRLCDFVFQFDNSRPNCAVTIKEFLEKKCDDDLAGVQFMRPEFVSQISRQLSQKRWKGRPLNMEDMALQSLQSAPSEVFWRNFWNNGSWSSIALVIIKFERYSAF